MGESEIDSGTGLNDRGGWQVHRLQAGDPGKHSCLQLKAEGHLEAEVILLQGTQSFSSLTD